jgi:hypothetical protein
LVDGRRHVGGVGVAKDGTNQTTPPMALVRKLLSITTPKFFPIARWLLLALDVLVLLEELVKGIFSAFA